MPGADDFEVESNKMLSSHAFDEGHAVDHDWVPTRKRAAKEVSLRHRAINFLSKRELSKEELRAKLQPYCEDRDEIDQVIEELYAKNLINHERVVETTIYSQSKKFGNERIIENLRSKGIESELIKEAQESLNESEADRAFDVLSKRFSQPAQSRKELLKHFNFLVSRGFNPGDTASAIRKHGCLDSEGIDDAENMAGG